MQIGSTLPAENLKLFQARKASFKRRVSALNPVRNQFSSASQSLKPLAATELTRQHLTNLEKLLQKQSPPDQPETKPVQKEPNIDRSLQSKGKNLIEGLNLARIWPQVLAADEMSPRHLNHLQRLLSKTAEYSPRNNLGNRWREYHGCDDWSGLLDPLDENLRREVIRYGEFVQAAYRAFHSNPAMSPDKAPLPRHVMLPDRSYKVTKSLYASSSIGLPSWVDDVAPELGWMTQRSSWIGYVAVCDDKREIERMGRRDIVIALRGTATCLEWAENVRAQLISVADQNDQTQDQSKVECGFLSLYRTAGAHVASLAESVVEEIHRLTELYKGEELSITVTGHSLGAALALLVADEISSCAATIPPIAVFSFGGPRVGNRSFGQRIESRNVKVLRIVNSQDVITRVPGPMIGDGIGIGNDETHSKTNGKTANALQMFVKNTLLAYSHVGTELRVDSKMSPYLKPNADPACCHDLEAYLHLVDGYLASNCPFRPTAKRSLVRLLQDQKSNMKKLYTSKGKALSLNLAERDGCLPSPST